MLSKLEPPITEERIITSQERAESLTRLMEFHEWVCTKTAVDPAIITEILLLLRRCYGFKRHSCGQLFYLRAVGIAEVVASWHLHTPISIYASLLYDLVHYTRLSLAYIRANYNPGIFAFVSNLIEVNSYVKLQLALLQTNNYSHTAVNQEHLAVLYIKLAERLYDLRHAAGYTHLEVVKTIAEETLLLDLTLANCYPEPAIVQALKGAAKEAVDFCNRDICSNLK